jgi:hypothetical protein
VKFGLVARDVRLVALVLVLGLVAVVLVVTSWPERNDLVRPRGAARAPVVEAARSDDAVPSAGRRVARRFAEAYFTTSSKSAAVRRERLEPYSSDELIVEMRINSGALALNDSRARAAGKVVVALQNQDGTEGNALVAIVERSARANGRTTNELVTVTLELVEQDGEWLVAEVLVP